MRRDLMNFRREAAFPHFWLRRSKEDRVVRKAALVLTTAGTLVLAAIATTGPAEAWRGGFGPGLAGGLIAGAVIGGLASSAYAWGPGYGYYSYGPAYYGPGYYHYNSGCPQRGYGKYYDCGAYAVPGYGAPAYYGYGPW